MNREPGARYQRGMTPLALWRHEIRRAGWAALLTPPVCAALIALLAMLQSGNEAATARSLIAVLEVGIPLAAGVAAGSLIGQDPAVELALCVRRSYRTTVLRRLTITLGWTAVLAVGTSIALTASGWWYRWPLVPEPVLGQLTWLAPAVCLGGLGFLLGALLRSPAAAGGLVAGVWLVHQVMAGPMQARTWSRVLNLFATTRGSGRDWLANRLVLLAIGAALLIAGCVVLARTERLMKGDE